MADCLAERVRVFLIERERRSQSWPPAGGLLRPIVGARFSLRLCVFA